VCRSTGHSPPETGPKLFTQTVVYFDTSQLWLSPPIFSRQLACPATQRWTSSKASRLCASAPGYSFLTPSYHPLASHNNLRSALLQPGTRLPGLLPLRLNPSHQVHQLTAGTQMSPVSIAATGTSHNLLPPVLLGSFTTKPPPWFALQRSSCHGHHVLGFS